MSEDLSTLDGNALVARLAVVKDRAALHAEVFAEGLGEGTGPRDPQDAIDAADTEAVLDECAVRLLRQQIDETWDASSRASKDAALETAARLLDGLEAKRLRGLIQAVVAADRPRAASGALCAYCGHDVTLRDFAPVVTPHGPSCPWPALVAEAEKP